MRSAFMTVVGEPERRGLFGRHSVGRRIILKQILKKWYDN
jgi:hypothetical protein